MISFFNSKYFSIVAAFTLYGLVALSARGDMLELTNGDHYRGTVLSLDASNVVFQSEIQGRVTLPRNKVAAVTLQEAAAKPVVTVKPMVPAAHPVLPATNAGTAGAALVPGSQAEAVVRQLRQQGLDSKLIDQVQQQIFGKASPEAAQKFNDLMGGLLTGRVSVEDIRKQAQNSINEIRVAKKELGGDAGDMLDSYLSVLEKFVQDAASDRDTGTSPTKSGSSK